MIGKPTIGWLGYIIIGRSPFRFGLLTAGILILGGTLIHEAKKTLTLTFQKPSKYPPPVIILSPNTNAYLTAFDACGIEAATRDVVIPSFVNVKKKNRVWKPEQDKVRDLLKTMRNPMTRVNATNDVKEENMEGRLKEMDRYYKKMAEKMKKLQTVHDVADEEEDFEAEDLQDLDLEEILVEDDFQYNGHLKRNVFVYLWTKTIFKSDDWAHFVEDLPGVHLHYFDSVKALKDTPLSTWKFNAGLNRQDSELSWLSATAGLLFDSGGFLMPTGMILTKPVTVAPFGSGMGLLASSPNMETVSSAIIGVPSKHQLTKTIMQMLENGDSDLTDSDSSYSDSNHLHTNAFTANVLSNAVKATCGTSSFRYLYISDCADYTLVPPEEIVSVKISDYTHKSFPETQTLLYFDTDEDQQSNPRLLNRVFTGLKLERFCPVVTERVKNRARRGPNVTL